MKRNRIATVPDFHEDICHGEFTIDELVEKTKKHIVERLEYLGIEKSIDDITFTFDMAPTYDSEYGDLEGISVDIIIYEK